MKTVNAQTITETIAHLCIDANRNLPKDVAAALHQAEETEPFAPAKELLSLLTKNEQIARTTQMPICQDTGMAVVLPMLGRTCILRGISPRRSTRAFAAAMWRGCCARASSATRSGASTRAITPPPSSIRALCRAIR